MLVLVITVTIKIVTIEEAVIIAEAAVDILLFFFSLIFMVS